MPYLGVAPNPRENREVDDISSGFNGGTTQFTLQSGGSNVSPGKDTAIIVSLGGVVQNPGTDYTIAASTITFTTAPASGLSFFGVVLAQSIDINTPADGTVTTAKIVNDAVTADKLAHTSVTAGSYTTADITVDAQGRITAAASGTISGAEIADQAVTNAKVNNSAAIAGTKISPDFGSQNIVTTGTLGSNALSVNTGTGNTCATFTSTDAGAVINITDNSARSSIEQNGTDLKIISDTDAGDADSTIKFQVDASTKMVLNSLGNVGIGTTTINDDADHCKLVISGQTGTAAGILIFQDASNNEDGMIFADDGSLVLSADRANATSGSTMQFRVDGSSEKMRIDENGKVGIGTTSPDDRLVLSGSTGDGLKLIDGTHTVVFRTVSGGGILKTASNHDLVFGTNDTERMRIDSSGRLLLGTTSVGAHEGGNNFTIAESGHCGMTIRSGSSDSGNIYFADGTGSGESARGEISYRHGTDDFRIFTSATERMRIDSSGNVRVNEAITLGTNAKLAVASSGINPRVFEAHATNSSFQGITLQSVGSRNTTNGSYRHFQCVINGIADKMRVEDSGNVTNTNNSYGSISDERLKENIVDASSQWDDIKALRIRKFNFKSLTDPDQKTMLGVVAQEAELVCPGLVTSEVSMQEGEEKEYKSFKYSVLYMKAIKCLQEAQAKIETLETKVAALEAA